MAAVALLVISRKAAHSNKEGLKTLGLNLTEAAWTTQALACFGKWLLYQGLRSSSESQSWEAQTCSAVMAFYIACLPRKQRVRKRWYWLTDLNLCACTYVHAHLTVYMPECVRDVDAVHSYVCTNVGECGKKEKRETEYKIDREISLQRRSTRPLKVELTSVPANVCRHPKLFIPENCKALLHMVWIVALYVTSSFIALQRKSCLQRRIKVQADPH